MWSAFFFDFEMDEDYCLCGALYNMVFTPFTRVDHHKSYITFAASFIAKEDIVSFEWLFRSFLMAMGGNEPNCMITDQDPAMKIVVTKRWNKVMVEYHLEEHEWLGYMYKIKDKWIPVYFRDVFLGGIMRTTSRSESENNFFCSFIYPHVSLVEFYLRYEASIDAQRHTQGQNDNYSKHKYPECKTPLGIEKHASHLYTNSVFYEFQYEKENGLEVAKVSEGTRTRTFGVVFNPTNYDTTCSCKLFYRQGIPCKHMIWVWKAKRFETIPEQYMLHRWTTMAMKKPIFDLGGNLLEQCANIIDKKKLLNDLWSEINTCVGLAEGKDEDIQDLVINLQGIRKDLKAKRIAINNETTAGSANNKKQDIVLLIGATVPTEIIVKPPKISKSKGTGVHVSNEETSKKKLKGLRLMCQMSKQKVEVQKG
ncbi:protein FAR1-RELATED SEQUENCE 5-like [Chenopodium quinoa]|uniref:protein FAR1-RELATED SEQUENCE 5-like n=1 Tax=Chenopodium quinoa TaxID=63459 RepID=UPI000B76D0E4|nr:protein FAR1-RELATED SEQUENCE 5-like [Chenopodium quinoa]